MKWTKKRTRATRRLTPALGLVMLFGSGCPDRPSTEPDAAQSVDARTAADGGRRRDAGPDLDSGVIAGADAAIDAGAADADVEDAAPDHRSTGFGLGGGGGPSSSPRYRATTVLSTPSGFAESPRYRIEIGAPLGR